MSLNTDEHRTHSDEPVDALNDFENSLESIEKSVKRVEAAGIKLRGSINVFHGEIDDQVTLERRKTINT